LYNIPFLETSAKESVNTNQLFDLTMKSYLSKVSNINRRASDNKRTLVIDLEKIEERSSNDEGCCLK
jgi:hypothetical protein